MSRKIRSSSPCFPPCPRKEDSSDEDQGFDYADDDSSPSDEAEVRVFEGVPIVEDVIPDVSYFNNAAKTALPPSVQEAGRLAMMRLANPWTMVEGGDNLEAIRSLYARLVNASSSTDICIAPSTAFAMTMAACNMERLGVFASNDDSGILVLRDQYDSVIYPFQDVCERTGAHFEVVDPPTDGTSSWTGAVLKRLEFSDSIKAVILPPLHWSNGYLLNLEKISKVCKERGVFFLIDATQALGVVENAVDVQEMDPDMVATSVHKWLLGPVGMSLVYLAARHQQTWWPLDQHGRSHAVPPNWSAGPDMMDPTTGFYPSDFLPGAKRCDSGGKPNPILVPMIRAGLEIVTRLNLKETEFQLSVITRSILEQATRKLGFVSNVPAHEQAPHIIGLAPGPTLADKLTPKVMMSIASRLQSRGIYLAVRCGCFRISPYLNTTQSDVQRLIQGLTEEVWLVLDNDM